MLVVSCMPDCALAANACVAVCTLLVLGVAFTCYVGWLFLLQEREFPITGGHFSCYGRQTFLSDE